MEEIPHEIFPGVKQNHSNFLVCASIKQKFLMPLGLLLLYSFAFSRSNLLLSHFNLCKWLMCLLCSEVDGCRKDLHYVL